MDAAAVARVRRFNRTVTERVGALSDRFLARDRPLGASRLLWEIGPEGREVRALRARLGLDSGYTSRLLRALESDGLVRVESDPTDRRVRVARLTTRGLAERRLLDRRSDDLAASMLEPLDARQRDELLKAMTTVDRLLTGSAVELRVVDPAGADARRCVRAYFAELDRRSDSGLDSSAAIPVDDDEVRPPAGAFLVAYLRGEPVGCGAVKHRPDRPAEIKRMWVDPTVRGRGVARRLLSELEARAAASGAPAVRLDTNRALVEAISMYRSTGYVEVPPFNDERFAHHWFEKRLGPV
jgi:DNA-binding MarR family transcriptional regulator/GNAT superfamily N-acetyltransferase